ncbi:MAG: hypothetical protein RLY61_749 [Candidatus Parcubacteria bacterium]|jgi:hypothetical protein
MIQEILKEFKKEFVSETFLEGTPVVAFYNEEDRTLDLWQWYKVEAFFEKSLKRVEEEARKNEREELRFWVKARSEAMVETSGCGKDSLCAGSQASKARNLLKDFEEHITIKSTT